MPLYKMAFRNLKSRKKEHLIYLFTLLLFSALLLASFLLPALLPSLDGENKQFVSNSLPAILLITQFFLTLYINRFMYKSKIREYAVYALSGIPNSMIIRLYTAEHLLSAGSLFLQSLLFYTGIFFTLYISYITLLYVSLKKTKIIFS